MSFTSNFNTEQIQFVLHKLGIKFSTQTDISGWQTISSPLREDNDPSFGLNIYTGAWKDHGTGEKGDLMNLVEEMGPKTTEQAMNWMKNILGLNDDFFDRSYSRNGFNQAFQLNRGDDYESTTIPVSKNQRKTDKQTKSVINRASSDVV